MVFDFFKNLAQQRVDTAVNQARAKQVGVVARAKGKAAGAFNNAVDAPLKAAKKGAQGARGAAGKAKLPARGQQQQQQPQAEGEGMGCFGRKKEAGSAPSAQEAYAQPDHTVAIDLAALQSATFQPVVGWVVVLNGELRGRDFRLVDGKNTMGTAADCDVVLTDPYLSSHHAVIRHENGEFTFVDLDSTNGSYVNERRVSREDLIDNDKIRLGRTELKFKSLE